MNSDFIIVLNLARQRLARIRQSEAEYDEACNLWAEEGFSPHYCIHGVDMWAENLCGFCEDSRRPTEVAVAGAARDFRAYRTRAAWLCGAPDGLPQDMAQALWQWALQPLD